GAAPTQQNAQLAVAQPPLTDGGWGTKTAKYTILTRDGPVGGAHAKGGTRTDESSKGKEIPYPRAQRPALEQPRASDKSPGAHPTASSKMRELIGATMAQAKRLEAKAACDNNCYMLAALSLLDVYRGSATKHTAQTLTKEAKRLKLWQGKRQEQRDPSEVLERLDIPVYPFAPTEEGEGPGEVGDDIYPNDDTNTFFVRTNTGREKLRKTLSFSAKDSDSPDARTTRRQATFLVGAQYAGRLDGVAGHFTLTDEPERAAIAVYQLIPDRLLDTLRDLTWMDHIAPAAKRMIKPRSERRTIPNILGRAPPTGHPPHKERAISFTVVEDSDDSDNADVPDTLSDDTNEEDLYDDGDSEDSDDLDPEEELMTLVKGAQLNQRIAMTWRLREGDGAQHEWTGTVIKKYDHRFKCCEVKWDAGLPGLKHPRVRAFPEAVLPDPKIMYIHTRYIPQASKGQSSAPTKATPRECDAPRGPLLDPPGRKNMSGDLCRWTQRCRTWYIHPERPPHISPLAWAATSAAVRASHIRWLRELRSMPADLVGLPLPKAALELTRRMATSRNWRWGTISRAMANIKAALLQLPIYTTESEAIDLSKDSEWAAAGRMAKRMERETPKNPPAPLLFAELHKIRQGLTGKPHEELFLMLMWSLAARASDIAGMNAEDVNLSEPDNLAVTIRRGKGAKFRGPYPAASTLERDLFVRVQELLASRRKGERLFFNLAGLRSTVRAAMKKVNPLLSLPSIRKGAARHMIEAGVEEDQVMRLTGHTRGDTFRGYLGYAEILTKEAKVAQKNTRVLQKPQGTEEPRSGPQGAGDATADGASGDALTSTTSPSRPRVPQSSG
ncbi:MAG: hypothetical protein COA68_12315, partial [Oceanobacter sp.]